MACQADYKANGALALQEWMALTVPMASLALPGALAQQVNLPS